MPTPPLSTSRSPRCPYPDRRDNLRQAIGQLYDYRRFHQSPVHRAVPLPYEPNAERLDLLPSAGIEAIWPYRAGFRDSGNGTFVEQ